MTSSKATFAVLSVPGPRFLYSVFQIWVGTLGNSGTKSHALSPRDHTLHSTATALAGGPAMAVGTLPVSLDDRAHCRVTTPRPQKVMRSSDVLTPSPRVLLAPGSAATSLIQPLSLFYKGSFDPGLSYHMITGQVA